MIWILRSRAAKILEFANKGSQIDRSFFSHERKEFWNFSLPSTLNQLPLPAPIKIATILYSNPLNRYILLGTFTTEE
jgi:hypothetical protein